MRNRSNTILALIVVPAPRSVSAKDRSRGVVAHGETALQQKAAGGRIPVHHFTQGEQVWISLERKVRREVFGADTTHR
jgi:hypothetical protein